jgi:hypothetical protein
VDETKPPTREVSLEDVGFIRATLLMASGALQALDKKGGASALVQTCIDAAAKLEG